MFYSSQLVLHKLRNLTSVDVNVVINDKFYVLFDPSDLKEGGSVGKNVLLNEEPTQLKVWVNSNKKEEKVINVTNKDGAALSYDITLDSSSFSIIFWFESIESKGHLKETNTSTSTTQTLNHQQNTSSQTDPLPKVPEAENNDVWTQTDNKLDLQDQKEMVIKLVIALFQRVYARFLEQQLKATQNQKSKETLTDFSMKTRKEINNEKNLFQNEMQKMLKELQEKYKKINLHNKPKKVVRNMSTQTKIETKTEEIQAQISSRSSKSNLAEKLLSEEEVSGSSDDFEEDTSENSQEQQTSRHSEESESSESSTLTEENNSDEEKDVSSSIPESLPDSNRSLLESIASFSSSDEKTTQSPTSAYLQKLRTEVKKSRNR